MATSALRTQVESKYAESIEKLLSVDQDKRLKPGLTNWSQAWTLAIDYLRPYDIKDRAAMLRPKTAFDMTDVRTAFAMLHVSRQLPALVEVFLEEMRKAFPMIDFEIRAYMSKYDETKNLEIFRMLVSRLHDWFKAWHPPIELGAPISSTFTLAFHTHLFSLLPPSFAYGFKALAAYCLAPTPSSLSYPASPHTPTGSPSLSTASPHTPGANTSTPTPAPMTVTPPHPPHLAPGVVDPTRMNLQTLWSECEALGLIERYESVISSVAYECIEERVAATCPGNWGPGASGQEGKGMLWETREWMTRVVVPWMLRVFVGGGMARNDTQSLLSGIGSRFDYHVNKVLCDLRIKEIFNIIVDYPDSLPALHDLRETLQRVDQRGELVKFLRKENKRRLLHPGADTQTILQQYVSTIKCLRVIDPPGVLLYKVANPIREYLRQRPDTIRCIVSSLVGDDENGDSLVDEDEPIQPLQQPEAEDWCDPEWVPEPVDAGAEFKTNKPADVLSTLVSIYPSKDLFVKELQVLLAQRLLSYSPSDTAKVDRERRSVEILKIRFGDAALQVCSVMLKDVDDSRRVDEGVRGRLETVVHPTIISHHFWPPLESGEIVLSGQMKEMQDKYAKEYSSFKPDKRLKWLSHLGTVHLEVELEDRTLDVDVTPLEAAFLELFSTQDVWKLEDLMQAVGNVDRSSAVKALSTWANMGVVKEQEDGTFILLEHAEEDTGMMVDGGLGGGGDSGAGGGGGGSLPPPPSAAQQQAAQMQVHWNFIRGMLTNLGELPLDRIQTMLRYVPNYDQNLEQLGAFMEAARVQGMVSVTNGLWRLN